jgi:flagellar hook-basal body complex protein FliE
LNIENISFQTGLKPLGIFTDEKDKALIGQTTAAAQPFESFFNAYLNIVEETNAYQNVADRAQVDFAAGKTDDMLSVMLSQEKAYASLNFTVQLTNKVIEAYKEIMRVQL